MKIKVLIPIFFSVLIGLIFGKAIFNEYDSKTINVFEEGEKIYFVLYDSLDAKNDALKIDNISSYLILFENNKYDVYVGITKDKNISLKIKDFYNSTNNNIDIKEKYVLDKSFLNILSEYDKVASIATKKEEMIAIQKIIISNYKEMVVDKNDANEGNS